LHTSILEGINNKIKVLKRIAYGFRDGALLLLENPRRVFSEFPEDTKTETWIVDDSSSNRRELPTFTHPNPRRPLNALRAEI